MKTKILSGMIVVLAAGCISVQAEDNASQAAARAALVKQLFGTEQPPTRPQSSWDSAAAAASPAKSTNRTAKPVVAKVAAIPIAPEATNVIAAPAPKAPPALVPVVAVRPVALPVRPQPPVAAPAISTANVTGVATKTPSPPEKSPSGYDLVTTTGATYRAALVEKVEPDGLVVSYMPAGGGIAITKVLFEDLPDALRRKYEKPKPATPKPGEP